MVNIWLEIDLVRPHNFPLLMMYGEQIFCSFLAKMLKHSLLKSYMTPEFLGARFLDLLDFSQAHLSLFGHSPRDDSLGQFLYKAQEVGVELLEFLHLALSLHFDLFQQ
jgi:hypothetical protein